MSEQTHRRLLDLLAGWADFASGMVEHCAGAYEVEFQAVWEEYQRVGRIEELTESDLAEALANIQRILSKP